MHHLTICVAIWAGCGIQPFQALFCVYTTVINESPGEYVCFQENGIYVVAKLILPPRPAAKAPSLQVGDKASCIHNTHRPI